jgi:hypothetical protein|eukprot:COSAG06_NODE_6145_length_3087_cov_3.902945_3_plen_144_part_00
MWPVLVALALASATGGGARMKTDDDTTDRGSRSVGGRPLVGIHYFGGWYPGPFSHWMKGPLPSTHSWLPDFPERTPLLGLHTTNRSTIKAELAAAQAHGVDWFEMLWYDPAVVSSCAGGEWPADLNLRPCTNTPIAWMVNDSR